jgi:hypothetical protein
VRTVRTAALLALALIPATASAGDKAAPKKDPDLIELSAQVKAKLVFATDGKGHYVAVIPYSSENSDFAGFYYGDGKDLYQQRTGSAGADGEGNYDYTFWEPRYQPKYGMPGELNYKDKKLTVSCGETAIELKVVAPEEGAKLLAGAKFHKPLWKHRAYALARDNTGIYYYVDKIREPEDSKDFRVFKGAKGKMKPLKMLNVVSDSEGDIFVTKGGELRLVLDKGEQTWIVGKKRTTLTFLPVEDNVKMIYAELGVYTTENLGTPCDDL